MGSNPTPSAIIRTDMLCFMDYIKAVSFDRTNTATLIFENEIRFGPVYYNLLINKQQLAGRIFGGELKWHDSANIFAVGEWLTTDYNEGPITRAVLFDLDEARSASLDTVNKGFVRDFHFAHGKFFYRKHRLAAGTINEVVVSEISTWERLTF